MIKEFKIFLEGHIGYDTSWSSKKKTITLQDINNYMDKKNIPVIEIDPKSIEHLLIKTNRDPQRIENANLDYPVILTKMDGKLKNILDGQHRLVKCINNGIEKIRVRILDLNDVPIEFLRVFN